MNVVKLYPNIDGLFGGFEIAGRKHTTTKYKNGRRQPETVEFDVYIDNADYIDDSVTIILPGSANTLNFEAGTRVWPVGLYLTVAGKRQTNNNNRGYAEYFIHAEKLVPEHEKDRYFNYVPSGNEVPDISTAGVKIASEFPLDSQKQFGTLMFWKLKREAQLMDGDGNSVGVKHRVYNCKSTEMGQMVQIIIPSDVAVKEYKPNEPVELINPLGNTVVNASFNEIDTNVYFRASDILRLGKDSKFFGSQNKAAQGNDAGDKPSGDKDDKKPA